MVNEIIKKLVKVTETNVKEITSELVANLYNDTPVDTGFARINWIPSIGLPFKGTAGTREAAELGSIDSNPQNNGLNQVQNTYTLNLGNVYITNNVEYITDLNEGSSRQAPSAFVQFNIAKSVRNVDN